MHDVSKKYFLLNISVHIVYLMLFRIVLDLFDD